MKTLLKIFLVLTIAHSDYIRLWVDEVQYIPDNPNPNEEEVYFKIRYDIVNTGFCSDGSPCNHAGEECADESECSDSGVQLLDDSGEDVNNIKSFRFTLGTFNAPLQLESDLGNIFSLVEILTASSETAFEAFNPSDENIDGFTEFYFAGTDTDGQGLVNQ